MSESVHAGEVSVNLNEIEELSEEQLAFAGFVIEELGLTDPELAMPVAYNGRSATIRDGIYMCIDHIAGMDEDAIRSYVEMLKDLSTKQQADG